MINKEYLKQENIEKIKEIIEKEGSIQLYSFLEKDLICKTHFKKEDIPNLYSYERAKFKDKLLIKEINNFLSTLFKAKLKSVEILCLKHKNYTLLNDNIKEEKGIKVILELTDSWNKEANGYTSFIKNNEEILRIYPVKNSLTMIRTDKDLRSFIKYVNHKAENKKRIFMQLFYQY